MSMPVTARSTKAEILAVLEAQNTAMQAGPTWSQVSSKLASAVSTASSEIVGLGLDLMHGWRLARVCYNQVTRELSRPLIKS
jgi:hypothetical protein